MGRETPSTTTVNLWRKQTHNLSLIHHHTVWQIGARTPEDSSLNWRTVADMETGISLLGYKQGKLARRTQNVGWLGTRPTRLLSTTSLGVFSVV